MDKGPALPRRIADRTFEWLNARPLSILVFVGSIVLLVYLQTYSAGSLRARAVARAGMVEHPALVSSFVARVYVQPGDPVDPGTPLVELSSYFVERELEQLNADIEQLLRESKLAQARLLVEEERWLSPRLRRMPSQPSVEGPTEELYAGQLATLQTRRALLQESRANLTIKSQSAGRVVIVAAPGSAVAVGSSVAAVTPEYAEVIVAFAAADTNPLQINPGVAVKIVRPFGACSGNGTVLRRGASVEQAPGQLSNFLNLPEHGMPVYISVPTGCQLGVGQVLSVEFPAATM